MEKKIEHSPLPFVVEGRDWIISKSNGDNICTIQYTPRDPKTHKANATFIVTACNSHYELVEALKEVVKEASKSYLAEKEAADWFNNNAILPGQDYHTYSPLPKSVIKAQSILSKLNTK